MNGAGQYMSNNTQNKSLFNKKNILAIIIFTIVIVLGITCIVLNLKPIQPKIFVKSQVSSGFSRYHDYGYYIYTNGDIREYVNDQDYDDSDRALIKTKISDYELNELIKLSTNDNVECIKTEVLEDSLPTDLPDRKVSIYNQNKQTWVTVSESNYSETCNNDNKYYNELTELLRSIENKYSIEFSA